MSRLPAAILFSLVLLLCSSLAYGQSSQALELTGSANISVESNLKSDSQHGQYELSLFLDAVHLDKSGIGMGYIHQNQGLSDRDDVVNDIMYYTGWTSWFPETLSGKVSFALSYYNGTETTSNSGADGGNLPGPGKPSPDNTTVFTDSLEIINPVLSFINYQKTLYVDIAYAISTYNTSDSSIGKLQVTQWSPAIGFAFNDQYDWMQIRPYSVDLSNDNRTPGISNTKAHTISWTHWVKKIETQALEKITLTLLSGERLYAVDHAARKVYNINDMQTGSLTIGANWKSGTQTDFYVYGGYERYEVVATNENYNSLFVYTGITTRW